MGQTSLAPETEGEGVACCGLSYPFFLICGDPTFVPKGKILSMMRVVATQPEVIVENSSDELDCFLTLASNVRKLLCTIVMSGQQDLTRQTKLVNDVLLTLTFNVYTDCLTKNTQKT